MRSHKKRVDDLSGRWPLRRLGEIALDREGLDEKASARAELIAAEPDALVVAISREQRNQKTVARTARLSGKWRVDASNRLVFSLEKGKGRAKTLSFGAGWELNDAHEIVLRRTTTRLKAKPSSRDEIVLKGRWDLRDARSLVYSLEGSASELVFRGSFQTRSILAKKGEVRWQIGSGASSRRGAKTLIFFGKWKASRDLGLELEWEGARGRRSLSFGASYSAGDRHQVAVGLKSRSGEPLGVEVVFTRGEVYLRAEKNAREALVESGFSFKW